MWENLRKQITGRLRGQRRVTMTTVGEAVGSVFAVIFGVIVVVQFIRTGALKEVLAAWPVISISIVGAGFFFAFYYVVYYRKGEQPPDNPYHFEFTLYIAMVVALVVVGVVVVIGIFILAALGLAGL